MQPCAEKESKKGVKKSAINTVKVVVDFMDLDIAGVQIKVVATLE